MFNAILLAFSEHVSSILLVITDLRITITENKGLPIRLCVDLLLVIASCNIPSLKPLVSIIGER